MKSYRVNNEINSQFVRFRDCREVVPYDTALKEAVENNTDLIEIATYDDNKVSVCILQDYQKFLYQQKKHEKDIKGSQQKVIVKELRFRPQTDLHDYTFKLNHAKEFIKSKARVKAFVMFKDREILYKEQGELLLLRLASDLSDIAKIESMPKLEGNRMYITIIPK